jgi:hypothetical protein
LSHSELTDIFSVEKFAEEFYTELNNNKLLKFVKNSDRRGKILENYSKLKTKYIDSVIEKLDVNIIIL